MGTWIKICGITNAQDAALAVELEADALGLVFHEASPRCCDVETARRIVADLPSGIAAIGVWLDEPADAVAPLARRVGITTVQTYSATTAIELTKRGFDVMPAIQPQSMSAPGLSWADVMRRGRFARVVVDYRGRRSDRARLWRDDDFAPVRGLAKVILAGGLTCDNVALALEACAPDGVDVASGVEAAPGKKDREKLERFVLEVRQWDAKASSGPSAADSCPKP